jgi:hypothetical protein
MSEPTYNLIAPEKGVPIKAWTKGVALEDEARKQLLNAAQLPFIFKWIARTAPAPVSAPPGLLHLHGVLKQRKYRMLFSPERRRRPGPKGPKKDLIDAVVAMKRRNPGWGCPRLVAW